MATKYYNIIFLICLILIVLTLFTNIQTPTKEALVPTEYAQIATNKEFQITPITLKKNLGVSFVLTLNSGYNGCWQQVLGITPFQDGTDARILGIWIHPNQNFIHIRTSTEKDWNDGMSGDHGPIPIGTPVQFDILLNQLNDGTQRMVVNMNNQEMENKTLSPATYSPAKGYTQAWVQTSYSGYQGCNIINGTIQNLVVTTGDTEITVSNLRNAKDYGLGAAATTKQQNLKEQFSMRDPPTQSTQLSGIGGLGNNGGIVGLTPPTTPFTTFANPTNYIPISINVDKSQDPTGTKPLCTKSVINSTDPRSSIALIENSGYNFPVSVGSDKSKGAGTVPICSPDELYQIQQQILNEINTFNLDYSSFMVYKFNKKHNDATGDTSKLLSYPKESGYLNDGAAAGRFDSINNVTDIPSYQQLDKDLRTYNNLLAANKAYYPNPEQKQPPAGSETDPLYKMDPNTLAIKHKEIMDYRNDLDKKLFELNNVQNSAYGESKMQMDGSIYVTILWTTLATSVIYFMFM